MARTKQKVLDDRREQQAAASAPGDDAEQPSNAEGEGEGEEEEEYVIERILAQRYVRKRVQYEVKWRDFAETTWEPAAHLADTSALEEWLKETSPPAELVRAMMHQLLSAVAHLHANHVIHSDIHPSNIFMDDTSGAWALRLGDFDVSLDLTARTQVMATAAGATLIGGREAYLPPEVKLECFSITKL